MKYSYFTELEVFLKDDLHRIEGCSDLEISKLKKRFSVKRFPDSYTEFLKMMGKYCFFLEGHSFHSHQLWNIRRASDAMLDLHNYELEQLHDPVISLNRNDFVFFMSQGVVFLFFKLDEGDDPKIYQYSEYQHMNEFVPINKTFTEFILERYHFVKKRYNL